MIIKKKANKNLGLSRNVLVLPNINSQAGNKQKGTKALEFSSCQTLFFMIGYTYN